MKDTQKSEPSVKKVHGVASRKSLEEICKSSFEFMKNLKKGEILHLRDDFRPYMKTRDWVFQDLFKGGGVFLHQKGEGFLEVKERDIDWETYRIKKQ